MGFIHAINTNDLAHLDALMSDDHVLRVFTEPPATGRSRNVDAWPGYCQAWPNYIIYPQRMAQVGDAIAIAGHTTGSHLELADEEERKLTLIWPCRTGEGKVTARELMEDTPANREAWGLA